MKQTQVALLHLCVLLVICIWFHAEASFVPDERHQSLKKIESPKVGPISSARRKLKNKFNQKYDNSWVRLGSGRSATITTTYQSSDYESYCLAVHNRWRRVHNAPDVRFNETLSNHARWRASTIASTDKFEHLPDGQYGENLAFSSRPLDCRAMVEMWYNEVKNYKFEGGEQANNYLNSGHFTQIVWRNTQFVGCAEAMSSTGKGLYLVCNYDPPGNVQGAYKENVLPPHVLASHRVHHSKQ